MPDPLTPSEHRALQIAGLLANQRELQAIIAAPPLPAYSAGRLMVDGNGKVAEDHSARVQAIKANVVVSERIAKLMALDAPERSEVTVSANRPATLAERIGVLRFMLTEAAEQGYAGLRWQLVAEEVAALELGDVARADVVHEWWMAEPLAELEG